MKALAAVERGIPGMHVSDLLGISLATISRYVKLTMDAARQESVTDEGYMED